MTSPSSVASEAAAAAYGEMFEAIPDAVVLADARGRIVFINQQTELLFGYPRQELLGRPVEVLLPERFRERHLGHQSTYTKSPRVRPLGAGLDLFGLRKDGSEVPVEISLSPSALQGELVVISTVRDVTPQRLAATERNELLQQLQALQMVTDDALAHLSVDSLLPELLERVREALQSDTAAILLLDEAGETLTVRAALGMEKWVEGGARIGIGQGFAGRVVAGGKAVVIEDLNQAEVMNPLLRARGIRSLLGVPLQAGGQVIGVLHVGSLARRRFTEQEAGLLQSVADRAALALDRARLYGEAREAVQMRNEFLSAVSHDLGNPVVAIRMMSRLLQAQAVCVQNAELSEGLTQIEATADSMWKQLEELVDLARLQMGRALELNWRRMDLTAMVRGLVDGQQATTDKHTFRLALAAPELFGEWDQTRLERVLTNVLSNAVKYSPDGGEIDVRLAREADPIRPAGWVVIEVRDHGIGIPDVDLPHIFERYRRGSNAAGRFPGNGIGLTGAREIVQHHGGALTVESTEGAGTCITVRLPCAESRL